MEITLNIPESIVEICNKNDITDETKIVQIYTNFVNDMLGRTWEREVDSFETYCENDDNVIDYVDE